MFCPECGTKIPDDAAFCPECGTKTGIEVVETPVVTSSEEKASAGFDMGIIFAYKKLIFAVVGVLVCVLLAVFLVPKFIKPTINLNKYMTVTVSGYDTVGKAEAVFDREKFIDDYQIKLDKYMKETKKKSLGDDEYALYDALFDSVYNGYDAASDIVSHCNTGGLDKTTGLSNGDTVTYSWDCDEDYVLENYGYKVKYDEITTKVSGLEKIDTFDPFDGVEIVFSGISPRGNGEVMGKSFAPEAKDLRFMFDKSSELKNGDEVTVSVYYDYGDAIDYCVETFNKIPSPAEKTITVSGLDEYISSSDQLTDAAISAMDKKARDRIDEKFYYAGDDENLISVTYIGNYFFAPRQSDDPDNYIYAYNSNYIEMVYKLEIHNSASNRGKTYDKVNTVYWNAEFADIILNKDGQIILPEYMSESSNSVNIESDVPGWWGNVSWYYSGYSSLNALYEDITENTEAYTCESNIDENGVQVPNVVDTGEVATGGDNNGFIFANSDTEMISEADIRGLSDEELRYAINELYARHGYIFKDEGLREYYSQFDWYVGTVIPDNFSMSLFNDIENENLKLLQRERDSRS